MSEPNNPTSISTPATPERRASHAVALEELSSAAESLKGIGAAQQTIAIRRVWMVAALAAMGIALLIGFRVAELLTTQILLIASGGIAAGLGVLYALVRSGFSQRFRDPSLTLAQSTGALALTLFLMYHVSGAHAVLMLLYLMAFLFSPLKLNVQQLTHMATFVLVGDLIVLALRWDVRMETSTPQLEALRWLALAFTLIGMVWAGGRLATLRSRTREINARFVAAIDTIKQLVTHDELTGVFNRRQIIEVLKAEHARTARYGSTWSVCMIDLDFFKQVNDTLGHAGGDKVLRGVAQVIDQAKRPIDAFGRYGGEEFTLVLPETNLAAAAIVGERVRSLVAEAHFGELGPKFRITVSVGIAERTQNEDWQATVARADRALYVAKQSGRNRVELGIDTSASARMPNPSVRGTEARAPTT